MTVSQALRAHPVLTLFSSILVVKLALLGFDPTVRLFFGDSASYIHSALTGWVPPDRSYLYGQLFRATALTAHSMFVLVLVQSLFGAIAAVLLFAILRANFETPMQLAVALAVLLAVEPGQLFYERMVMAESAGTLSLVAMFAAGFAYLRRPHWLWPILWAAAGILAVAFRLSDLPVVLGFAVLPVLAGAVGAAPRVPARKFVVHLAVALVATAALHDGYRHWYAWISGTPRADYIADTGYFRLGLVAPLVTREEVVRAGLPADLLDHVGPDLRDPRMREAQVWEPNGLIALVREAGNGFGNRAARKLSSYALRGDPSGLLWLSWSTVKDYFDPAVVAARIADDVGSRPAGADLTEKLRRCCNYDASVLAAETNPIARYFKVSTLWLTACYFGLLPLAIAMLAVQWQRARSAALLLAATGAGMVCAQTLFAHIVSFRYLHPFPFVVLLCVGALASAFRGGVSSVQANVSGGRMPVATDRQATASRG
ncbi:MAG TPA: hypothetical protein VLK26_10385, partial [Rudaea sp.]|nr:hypothetical protein [Rudaea sp.]